MHDERRTHNSGNTDGSPGYGLSRAIAWSGFFLGAATGLLMGLWAFDGPVAPPAALAEYGDVSRRLLRLGHIAFFGIGYLNLLLVGELATSPLRGRLKSVAAHSMNVANVLMPSALMAASIWPLFKYSLPVPAMAATVALAIAAYGAIGRVMGVTSLPADTTPLHTYRGGKDYGNQVARSGTQGVSRQEV